MLRPTHNELPDIQNATDEHRRNVAAETNMVATGKSPAQSSYKAPKFHLISPRLIRRLATRLTVGGDKYGSVQWRQGINDAEYVTDRFNHFIDHLLKFMEDGNSKDDNLGAMIWGLHALVEVEELAPEALKKSIGICKLFGEEATKVHNAEMVERADVKRKEETIQKIVEYDNLAQAAAPSQNPYGGGLLGLFRRN